MKKTKFGIFVIIMLIITMIIPAGATEMEETGENDTIAVTSEETTASQQGNTTFWRDIESAPAIDEDYEIVWYRYLSEDAYEGKYSYKLYGTTSPETIAYSTPFKIFGAIFPVGFSFLPTVEEQLVDCNVINLYIKPCTNAENISFYIKIKSASGDETLLNVLSDYDGDGIYELGEDFVQGKWCNIRLDLLKVLNYWNEDVIELCASTNESSQWLIDEIKTEKRIVNNYPLNLSGCVQENLVYSDGLKFSTNTSADAYNNQPIIITPKVNVEGQITDINIEEDYETLNTGTQTNYKNHSEVSIDCKAYYLTSDARKLYYIDKVNSYLNVYNFSTGENKTIEQLGMLSGFGQMSDNNRFLVVYRSGAYMLYDFLNNTYETLSQSPVKVNNNGEIISNVLSISATKYYDNFFNYCVAVSSNVGTQIYEKEGGVWTHKLELYEAVSAKSVFYNNGFVYIGMYDTFNKNIHKVNLNTYEQKNIGNGYLNGVTEDGFVIMADSNNTTGTKTVTLFNEDNNSKLSFNFTDVDITKPMAYNHNLNRLIYVNTDGNFVIYNTDETEMTEYLLSFDGRANWYSYKNNRWIKVSSEDKPTAEDYENYGMTGTEISQIPSTAYLKMYEDNTSVYSVNFAIKISSYSNKVTPVIKNIEVISSEKADTDYLYTAKFVGINADDYSKINKIYLIENMPKDAEINYLFLHNDTLYNYDDGFIILGMTPEMWFSDQDGAKKGWYDIKYMSMSKQEMLAIPEDELNAFMTSRQNATSDNFGIVYCMKVDDTSTKNYTVDVKIDGVKKYVGETESTLEIELNNGETKTFTSENISNSEIEKFMMWVDERQKNKGSVFYKLNDGNKKHFINYYTITNISVY